ncbi:hypothetical protein ACFLYH_00930 [Candidatus Dependentiae bacterium]
MVDARNLTTYTYKEELANNITKNIPEYQKLMSKILEITAQDL